MHENNQDVLFEKNGTIAKITLNRPEKLNTVTHEMGLAILSFANEINEDNEIRAVVVTGTGARAFSAGSDINALDAYGSNWQFRNRASDYTRAIWSVRKPVIAAIRGYAIGGGLELALMCDIRIASRMAQFGAGEIKLGWNGAGGNSQLLPRLVGYGKALEMLLTGDFIDATEAHRIGLVQQVVADEDLESTAEGMARRIARNAPIAVQVTKHLVRIAESSTIEVGLAYENDLSMYCFTTEDSKEGIAAFREKRPPRFSGA